MGNALPDDVEFSFESLVVQTGTASEEKLTDKRLDRLRRVAKEKIVGGHAAPAQHLLPFGFSNVDEDPLACVSLFPIGRQKNHADLVLTLPWQLDVDARACLTQEFVGNLHEDAGTIARVLFAAAGTTVIEIDQHVQRLSHDLVGLGPLDVNDKPDPTRIVFVFGIVQSLLLRNRGVSHRGPENMNRADTKDPPVRRVSFLRGEPLNIYKAIGLSIKKRQVRPD